jgi:ADP-ribose pyrophosphatase YjhB (NUDIX family)
MKNKKTKKTKLKLRSTAVAIHNHKVLIYQTEGAEYWSLPGGRVELNEDSRQTLIREMQEETGLSIQIQRLLWVSENFFARASGRIIHEVSFYYLVELESEQEQPFEGAEKNTRLFFRWVDLDELDDIKLVPAFLKGSLGELPKTTQHLITRKIKP